jgi:TPR repeat protein
MKANETTEVANEATMVLSDSERVELERAAQAGNANSAMRLADFYAINFGEDHIETIRWELQAARSGDCSMWADLNFRTQEDGQDIPAHLFTDGETLASIGLANGCGQYVPVKRR